jgi:hypothetical protein
MEGSDLHAWGGHKKRTGPQFKIAIPFFWRLFSHRLMSDLWGFDRDWIEPQIELDRKSN